MAVRLAGLLLDLVDVNDLQYLWLPMAHSFGTERWVELVLRFRFTRMRA